MSSETTPPPSSSLFMRAVVEVPANGPEDLAARQHYLVRAVATLGGRIVSTEVHRQTVEAAEPGPKLVATEELLAFGQANGYTDQAVSLAMSGLGKVRREQHTARTILADPGQSASHPRGVGTWSSWQIRRTY